MIRIRPAPLLAVVATGTAVSMSALAGWQRGGTLPEQVVWIAVGVVLVVSAHLLPALLRDAPATVRLAGTLLWGSCMVAACYGHAYFYVLAQQHAGEARASAVPDVGVVEPPLAPVMEERARVAHELATASAQHCSRNCNWLDVRRTTLASKLDALEAQADDIRRQNAERDRMTALRDARLTDSVTTRLATLLGISTSRVELLSGLGFAAVLEGVACLLWFITLQSPSFPAAVEGVTDTMSAGITPSRNHAQGTTGKQQPEVVSPAEVTAETRPTVTRVTPHRAVTTDRHTPHDDPPMPSMGAAHADDAVARLAQAIAAGRVRPTVASIRRYLGCSQARATALRRQIVGSAS